MTNNFVKAVGSLNDIHLHNDVLDHVIIKLDIGEGKFYEVDINIENNTGIFENEYASLQQYMKKFPFVNGIEKSRLNYENDFNIGPDNFVKIDNKILSKIIIDAAKLSSKIIVYGFMTDASFGSTKVDLESSASFGSTKVDLERSSPSDTTISVESQVNHYIFPKLINNGDYFYPMMVTPENRLMPIRTGLATGVTPENRYQPIRTGLATGVTPENRHQSIRTGLATRVTLRTPVDRNTCAIGFFLDHQNPSIKWIFL